MFRPTAFLRVSAALGLLAAGAVAQADCIPISSLPYAISQSGSYCVTADISVNLPYGDAISINANDVDLDFQGHTITNSASIKSGAGVRLVEGATLTNVTVHNGTVYSFNYGVIAENLIASNLTIDHINVWFAKILGISLRGTNVRVTNNQVNWTVGTTFAIGIQVNGNPSNMTASNRAVVQGNVVSSVRMPPAVTAAAVTAIGIYVASFPDIVIRDNKVYSVWVPAAAVDGSGSMGIMINQMGDASARVGGLIVQDNTVANNVITAKQAKPNAVGIMISFPGDHAIVTGSIIAWMNLGIDANNASYPNTPPILLLNSTITDTTTPIKDGVTLPQ
jgi:hypothetical protein